MPARIPIDHQAIADFCRRHRIRKLSLYGSVLREDFGPDSDVDVLVEFESGASVGLLDLAGMQLELSDLFGRAVHVTTPGGLSRYMREDVLTRAEPQYDAA